MYIVPHSAPAASAAATPRNALPPGAGADDATASSLAAVVPHRGGAAHQRREAPARQEHADHHHEGNDDGRDAEGDELGGCFGGAEPGAGGEPGQDADALQAGEARRVELGQAIHRSTNRPAMSTASGIHKWTSPSRARQRETVVGCTGTLA